MRNDDDVAAYVVLQVVVCLLCVGTGLAVHAVCWL